MKRFLILILAILTLTGCGSVGKVDTSVIPQTEDYDIIKPEQPPIIEVPAEQKLAQEILSSMSLEEKVGQMFIARCPTSNAADKAAEYALGGYVLFARDFEGKTTAQVTSTIASYQESAKIPMLIAVDEEGGTVTRISRFPAFRASPFKSPSALYKEGGLARISEDTLEKSALLLSLGVNVNLSPVCDITLNQDSFMSKRSLGLDAQTTAQYVTQVVSDMAASGVGSVLKHFPGYGETGDSHVAITYDNKALETFYDNDFIPFKAGAEAGAGAVLVNHNIVLSMDAESPASLSHKVHEILRAELGHDIVVMTDDLYMDAIRKQYSLEDAAIKAVQAGNDLICVTDFEVQIAAVTAAVRNGTIDIEQVDQSVMRILLWKIELGLIE